MASDVAIFARVVAYYVQITLIDSTPEFVKRWQLSGEYSGRLLEERVKMRIGHPRMFTALWRMTSINMRPGLAEGQEIPQGIIVEKASAAPAEIPVTSLDLKELSLSSSLSHRPLVLNFGSCT